VFLVYDRRRGGISRSGSKESKEELISGVEGIGGVKGGGCAGRGIRGLANDADWVSGRTPIEPDVGFSASFSGRLGYGIVGGWEEDVLLRRLMNIPTKRRNMAPRTR